MNPIELASLAQEVEPWFDPNRFGALFGAIGGSGLGLLGALIGVSAGILTPKGKGRGFVLGMLWLMVILGFLSLLAGLYALIQGQPREIWYGPVLLGVVAAGVATPLIPVVRKRYLEAESRKMEAESLRKA